MNKPCEYCGCDLPMGVDKHTRQVRSFHFERCEKRPQKVVAPVLDPHEMRDLLLCAGDAIEALDGTSIENERLVDDYRAWRRRQA